MTHWEYWPFKVIYIPIYFLWAFYSVKAKSFFFFNASNPTFKNGGFIMVSKKAIYNLIPQKYYPRTELIEEGMAVEEIKTTIEKAFIQYPCFAKPDIGLRGCGVKKINTVQELEQYAMRANFDFLVQDLIPFQNEVGIFYVRYPNEKKGKITGIVSKEFLIVTGNGLASIEELIKLNPRYELQLEVLKQEYGIKLLEVLPKGEKLNLMPYGNHSRGAKFIDGSHWVTQKLEDTINEICLQIPGFFFGRMDVMYNSFEELENGKNFFIVELNGAASEPTHIYDPKHSLFFAWKELAQHITYMYEISVANNRHGIPYLKHRAGMKEYRLHIEQNNKIVNFLIGLSENARSQVQ